MIVVFVLPADPEVCTPRVWRGSHPRRKRGVRHVHHARATLSDPRQSIVSVVVSVFAYLFIHFVI